MYRNPKKQTYVVICIIVYFFTAPLVKAQPSAKDICGVYKITSSKTDYHTPLLQLTYIEKDTYWMYYWGLLQVVKPVKQGSGWELNPVQKIEHQPKLVYKSGILAVQNGHLKTTYKKFKLPVSVASLFDSAKMVKYQLYELDGTRDTLFTGNYLEINKGFWIDAHKFKNTSEGCKPYFMLLDISEPLGTKDGGIRVNFRAYRGSEDEFKTCKTPDGSKSYIADDVSIAGRLYFNQQGDLQALMTISYMNARMFVNKKYSIEDGMKLMGDLSEQGLLME